MNKYAIIATLLVASLVVSSVLVLDTVADPEVEADGLKTFNSILDLKSYVTTGINNPKSGGPIFMENEARDQAAAPTIAGDFSQTNVQVAGVDEADIVKTDGQYIYLVTQNRFLIVDAVPATNMRVLTNSSVDGYIRGLFINQDRLIIFEENTFFLGQPRIMEGGQAIGGEVGVGIVNTDDESREEKPVETQVNTSIPQDPLPPVGEKDAMFAPYVQGFKIKVFDTTDKSNPELIRDISMNGTYINSRMIGDWVYIVAGQSAIYWLQEGFEVVLPAIEVDGKITEVPVNQIHYSDNGDISAAYTIIVAINIQDETVEPSMNVMISGFASTLYVSQQNIYVILPDGNWWSNEGLTVIHRIAINQGKIEIMATGTVPGMVLNQYSVDEYENHLRIATTTRSFDRQNSESNNNIYVLNQDLETVGTLEDLAPGEQIFSARFMGPKGYLVTFRNVDPLFVIDLSNPTNPNVLGKLKIPGYSNYLHPFDENHIIGIGKDAVQSKQGDFALYQGMKISLFNIADVNNPIEVSTFYIGDRGTDSNVLYDPHALLFDPRTGLMVFPVLEAQINPEKYPQGVPLETYGDYVFQGAYALTIDAVNGITLKGTLTHIDDPEIFIKSGYYLFSQSEILRSLYIGDTLYTISAVKIQANNINTLNEIASIMLSQ
ncbi:beta-propeller domain-containing protein [Thermoproteota archaeon]